MSNPTRPAMPIKSRLPDDLDKAYSHALDYAIELEQVWAPKVLAYMDHCEATIKRLREFCAVVLLETGEGDPQARIDDALEDNHE